MIRLPECSRAARKHRVERIIFESPSATIDAGRPMKPLVRATTFVAAGVQGEEDGRCRAGLVRFEHMVEIDELDVACRQFSGRQVPCPEQVEHGARES